MPSLRVRSHGTALLIALVAACAVATPASGATKPYSVVVSPSAAPAGQRVDFTATFTNRTDQQQLGSANLTAPAGFTVVSASVPSPATATVSGNVVQLRDLALQPGASLVVSVTADVPCEAGVYTWSVIAKQANNFSGPPGNDLGPLVDSSLTTSVNAGCAVALQFVGQPANAIVNETITTTPYNSPPGGPVTVEVIDGAGNRATTSKAVITLSLAEGSGTATLSGNTQATAVNGLATFADLKIDTQGSYALVASSPGLDSARSNDFRIDEAATVCREDVACTATLSNANATFRVTAQSDAQVDAGVLVVNRKPLDCAGYTELSKGGFAVDFLPDFEGMGRAKVATLTIDKQTMNEQPDNGASMLNMCFGALFRFPVKPGTADLQEPEPGLFVGLLPDCGEPPCVSKRNKTGAGQGVIEARAPRGDDDPRFGG
jgi:hypothetical protein